MTNEQYIEFYRMNIPSLTKIVECLRVAVFENKNFSLLKEFYEKSRLLNKMKKYLKERLNK